MARIMLEFDELLIEARDNKGRRRISSVSTKFEAGFAFRRTPATWIDKIIHLALITIHECGDEPLVFSIRRNLPYLGWYEVLEAEDQRLGRVVGPLLQKASPVPWACHRQDGGESTRIETIKGGLLARFHRNQSGTFLHFDPGLGAEPYLKMLILASVLVNTD